MNIEEQVKKLVEEEVTNLGVIIDSIEYVKEGGNNYLRITIDRDEPVDLDTCVEVTNVINPILDKNEDIFEDSYILEVMSKERGNQ